MAKALATHDRGAGRHPLKQREIAAHLASEIRSGNLQPGSRLPVREELKERFSTTSTTIQRTFDQLVEEGILTTRPRQGTFVADHPPCLSRIAVAFPSRHGSAGWRGVDDTLWRLCQDRDLAPAGFQFDLYDGLENERDGGASRRQQLADDMILGRLAGVIFSASPHNLYDSPIFEVEHFPRIAIQTRNSNNNVAVLAFDEKDTLSHGLQALRERGCRRLALLTSTAVGADYHEKVRQTGREHGFIIEPHWFQAASLNTPEWSANITHLLLNLPDNQRPDAIYVQDDTLLPHCINGANRSTVRIGDDLHILAHCNFPAALPPHAQILRMGHDFVAGLQRMVDHLSGQRLGKRQPRCITVPARFEWEDA